MRRIVFDVPVTTETTTCTLCEACPCYAPVRTCKLGFTCMSIYLEAQSSYRTVSEDCKLRCITIGGGGIVLEPDKIELTSVIWDNTGEDEAEEGGDEEEST